MTEIFESGMSQAKIEKMTADNDASGKARCLGLTRLFFSENVIELNQAYSAAGASLYQAQGAGGGAGPDAGPQGGPEGGAAPGGEDPRQDDVVEADYEIVDDKK